MGRASRKRTTAASSSWLNDWLASPASWKAKRRRLAKKNHHLPIRNPCFDFSFFFFSFSFLFLFFFVLLCLILYFLYFFNTHTHTHTHIKDPFLTVIREYKLKLIFKKNNKTKENGKM